MLTCGVDVYQDASAHGRIVVGGSARTVGAAGGYLTGGGHSAWSHYYGLAVDSGSSLPPDMSVTNRFATRFVGSNSRNCGWRPQNRQLVY